MDREFAWRNIFYSMIPPGLFMLITVAIFCAAKITIERIEINADFFITSGFYLLCLMNLFAFTLLQLQSWDLRDDLLHTGHSRYRKDNDTDVWQAALIQMTFVCIGIMLCEIPQPYCVGLLIICTSGSIFFHGMIIFVFRWTVYFDSGTYYFNGRRVYAGDRIRFGLFHKNRVTSDHDHLTKDGRGK